MDLAELLQQERNRKIDEYRSRFLLEERKEREKTSPEKEEGKGKKEETPQRLLKQSSRTVSPVLSHTQVIATTPQGWPSEEVSGTIRSDEAARQVEKVREILESMDAGNTAEIMRELQE